MSEIEILKPWLPHKARTKPITTIVAHATAGSTASGAISTLRQRGLSYHNLIQDQREKDGHVVKCAPWDSVAFHAGKSVGPGGQFVNNYSLGFSFVNLNTGADPYSQAQFDSFVDLCVTAAIAYPSIKWLTTHYWISPGRKTDPKGFPIDRALHAINDRLAGKRGPLAIWKPKR